MKGNSLKIGKNDLKHSLHMKGVRILERKVSKLFKNGQKKCPKLKSLDILLKSRGTLPYFKINVCLPKK
jgi:hypothetical protein